MDRELYMSLMNRVRQQMADGMAQPSMVTVVLGRQAESGPNISIVSVSM